MWEQYIRDLAVFGTNAIELIPPRSDDAADSPHFPLPPMHMMIEMSRLADRYGLDVWIWYPAMDRDYSDPKTVEFALQEWGEVFRQLPRIDAVFVPGGDPGHTEPKYLMALLEKQTAGPAPLPSQGADVGLAAELQPGLDGRVPRHSARPAAGVAERRGLRPAGAHEPARAARRRARSATRSATIPTSRTAASAQYPVPDWDVAYAVTEAREVINPRPVGRGRDLPRYCSPTPSASSLIRKAATTTSTRSSGARLGWNPDADVTEILREYGRYFIGARIRRQLRARPAGAGAQLARSARRQRRRRCDARTVPGDGARRHAAAARQLALPAGALPRLLRRLHARAACIYETRTRRRSHALNCATPSPTGRSPP